MVGRIALVLSVVGTNFAAFFVTFFDFFLFAVEAKTLQVFQKFDRLRIMLSNSDWQNYKYTKETNCMSHLSTCTAQSIKARPPSAYLWLKCYGLRADSGT